MSVIPRDIDTQYDEGVTAERFLASKDRYVASGALHPSTAFIRERLSVASEGLLVDVGCGGGDDLLRYRDLGFADAVGVEPSERMAAAARALLGAEAVRLGSWKRIPLSDGSVSYCVGRASLQYEADLDAAYREAARILKPGGMLLIAVPHPEKAKDKKLIRAEGREYVQDVLFGDVTVTYPRHSLEDYFSPTFRELFELPEEPQAIMRQLGGRSVFDHLAFVARKRRGDARSALP